MFFVVAFRDWQRAMQFLPVDRRQRRWDAEALSPTILQSGPYRFFFFSSDSAEPLHVHVARDRKIAKFWLRPVAVEYNNGFATVELRKIEGLVRVHQAELLQAWHGFFDTDN